MYVCTYARSYVHTVVHMELMKHGHVRTYIRMYVHAYVQIMPIYSFLILLV